VKISELIERLEEIKSITGDIEMAVGTIVCGQTMLSEIQDVGVDCQDGSKVVSITPGLHMFMAKLLLERKRNAK
jgi:hypothetical protein